MFPSVCLCLMSHTPDIRFNYENLYSQLTTATHTNICRVQSHLLFQTAASALARCVCVCVTNATYLPVRHNPLSSECVWVWVCVRERESGFWEYVQLVAGNVACLRTGMSVSGTSLLYHSGNMAEVNLHNHADYRLHQMEKKTHKTM